MPDKVLTCNGKRPPDPSAPASKIMKKGRWETGAADGPRNPDAASSTGLFRGVLSGSPGTLEMSWHPHPNPDVMGFNVYRSLVSGGAFEELNYGLFTSTTCLDTGLLAGTTYCYVIAAVDRLGRESLKD